MSEDNVVDLAAKRADDERYRKELFAVVKKIPPAARPVMLAWGDSWRKIERLGVSSERSFRVATIFASWMQTYHDMIEAGEELDLDELIEVLTTQLAELPDAHTVLTVLKETMGKWLRENP